MSQRHKNYKYSWHDIQHYISTCKSLIRDADAALAAAQADRDEQLKELGYYESLRAKYALGEHDELGAKYSAEELIEIIRYETDSLSRSSPSPSLPET